MFGSPGASFAIEWKRRKSGCDEGRPLHLRRLIFHTIFHTLSALVQSQRYTAGTAGRGLSEGKIED
jgi:hypothetical protein